MVSDKLPILVVKVGTSTLLGVHDRPKDTFEQVATSIRRLSNQYRIVLVTSGAIGFGVVRLELTERPEEAEKLQALSMIGQVGILRQWREAFDPETIGQVLVTRQDLERQASKGAFRASVEAVWEYGAVPIVNENDAVSSEEISFGDNDRLAAEVASVLGAEWLVMLTDQDGIQADFGMSTQRRLETATIEAASSHIKETTSHLGRGGASSKLVAAQVALKAGVRICIAHAADERVIERALTGQAGTKIVQ